MFFRVKGNKLINPLIVIKSFAIIIFFRSLDFHRFLRGAAEAAAGRGSPPPPWAGVVCLCIIRVECFWFVAIAFN